MRLYKTLGVGIAACVCALPLPDVRADEPAPDGDKILALLGADLPTVFATLGGPPSAFVAGRDEQPEAADRIFLDYQTYFLELNNARTSVARIKFGSAFNVKADEWKGTIHGFKYGDGREKVQAALGPSSGSDGFGKTKDGKEIKKGTDYFPLKNVKGRLVVYFDNDGNVSSAEALGEF